MPVEDGVEKALAARSVPGDRAVFSLEMGRNGVRIRLAHAAIGDLCAVSDLVLRVPHVRYPFDYSSGPRALASHLSCLESVTLRVSLRALSERLRRWGDAGTPGTTPPAAITAVVEAAGRLVLLGKVGRTPVSTRLEIASAPAGDAADVRLLPAEPRAYGRTDGTGWPRIPALLLPAVPGRMLVPGGAGVGLALLRPLLGALLAPLGFKVPVTRGVRLVAAEAGQAVVLRFAAAPSGPEALPAPAAPQPVGSAGDPESAARAALEDLAGDPGNAEAWTRFLSNGVACPRLLPEVFARGVAAGEDRPERADPHLAALVAASAVPDAPPAVLARCCSRLVSALDGPAEAYDLVLAARLVASISDRLEPAAAAALLDSVRARVADPAVLDATARVMERTGRASEAAALRTRALSLSPAGDAVGLLEGMVESATAAGLGEIAPGWLEEVLRACDGGLFGSEGPAIRHRALLALASVLALSEGTRARAREVVRGELDRSPADLEALDLLVAIAGSGREASEAASRLRAAAASCRGQEAADLLARAAAIHSGLGLRRQAAAYLEEALAAVPGDRRVADLLDAAYGEAGLAEARRALAERRLAAATAPEERVGLLSTAARLAAEAGDLEAAGVALAELLELDPGDRDALGSARDLLARAGGPARLAAVLRDLDGPGPATAPPDAPTLVASAERALGQGDLGAATALLEMAVVLDPDAAGARALLAGAYRASDRPDLAAALEG